MIGRQRPSPTGRSLDRRAFDLLSLTISFVLAVHAPHLPWWLDLSLAAILGGRWWQQRQYQGRVPRWLKLSLLAVLTLAVVIYYGSVFGRAPGAALAVGLLVLKLLETEQPRDARVGVGFACFGLMTALLFNQQLVATFVVALGLLPALATLRALELGHRTTSLPRSLLPGLGLLTAAVPLALLAFLLVPRLSTPLWGAPSAEQARTGLSQSMSPGNFTNLLIDDHPAMRVSFDGAVPAPDLRYFRAYVMWNYDGRRWRYFRSRRQRPPAPLQSGRSIAYQITLQPTEQRVLPALDMPLAAPENATLEADHEVIANKPVNQPRTYRLRSTPQYRLQTLLSPGSRRRGLELPPGFNPKTLALARQWRSRYGTNDRAIVRAALDMFHNDGFSYTLAPPPLGRDAVDDFLFDTRAGFCEHYSSSFTVLMRAAGIPARVVTGFQGGYWNKFGSYLLVRYSDAHAWSEVWLAGQGWMRVDPTAAVRPERVSMGAAAAAADQLPWYQNDWLQGIRNHWDIVNRWWGQAVVGFDALRQRGLLTPFGIRHTDTATLALLLALCSVVFIALGVAWALLQRRSHDRLLEAMRKLQRKLARQGVTRQPSEGPDHYLRRASRALPKRRDELNALRQSYLWLRYAHDTPPAEPVRQFKHRVRNF